ncbi:MAG: hypothetical protein ACRETH_10340 [Steroidobacteraceae bacterium]
MDVLDAILVVAGGLLCWFAAIAACEPVVSSAVQPARAAKPLRLWRILKAVLLLGGVPLLVANFMPAPELFQFVVAIGLAWALMEVLEALARGR